MYRCAGVTVAATEKHNIKTKHVSPILFMCVNYETHRS